ncbi:hypothetical protein RB151_032130 [Providencia rettgeri]|uniref:hypothetical protein n=1 Tax=Providencia rettgeri TaxID=587 RepID=UPI0008FAFC1F|nr:hypothetical protein RB151_032130 [Providencia rettgeri]
MSIWCDFCCKNNSITNQGMIFATSSKGGMNVNMCEHCIVETANALKERKNSEAPTAGTGEASDLSGTKE